MHDLLSWMKQTVATEQDIIDSCACLKVRMASRAVTRAYDEALRPVGLRATQLIVLVAMAMDGAMSITSLATFLGMDRSTLKRTVTPLENDGLVAVSSEGWRRSRMLEITKSGRAKLHEAIPLWERAQQVLMKRLGTRDWNNVQVGLNRLVEVA